MKLAKVSSLSTTNYKKLGIPPILFSEEDRQGLHFHHDDALVIRVQYDNFLLKRVLVDEGISVDIVFLATLRRMNYEVSKLQIDEAKKKEVCSRKEPGNK